MIDPIPHTDGDESFEHMCKWIREKVLMPDGDPVPEHIVKVLAVGATIGARFSLLSATYALGLAHYANEQTGPLWGSIQRGFAQDYAELLNLPRGCVAGQEAQIQGRISPDSADRRFIDFSNTSPTPEDDASSTPEQHLTTNGPFDQVQR